MPRLPADPSTLSSEPFTRRLKRNARRSLRAVMKSRSVSLPRNMHMPIRLRPWFLLFTSLIMIILALLGFTNIARNWPLNDKILHFVCLGLATGVFYFIFDVDEDARRIWFWRYSGLIVTAVVCFLFGGVVSEIVQSLLPYKTFDFWDVVANLLGSTLGLYISYHIERHYRRRREISRLYKPLYDDSSDGEDEELGGPSQRYALLSPPSSSHSTPPPPAKTPSKNLYAPPLRFKNVWDDSMDVFGVGGDGEEEEDRPSPSRKV